MSAKWGNAPSQTRPNSSPWPGTRTRWPSMNDVHSLRMPHKPALPPATPLQSLRPHPHHTHTARTNTTHTAHTQPCAFTSLCACCSSRATGVGAAGVQGVSGLAHRRCAPPLWASLLLPHVRRPVGRVPNLSATHPSQSTRLLLHFRSKSNINTLLKFLFKLLKISKFHQNCLNFY